MTPRLTGHERALVAAFAGLSLATSIAMLGDLQVVSLGPNDTIVGEMIGLVRRLVAG